MKYAELIHTLHSTEASDAGFGSIKESYLASYKAAEQYYTPEEMAVLYSLLDMIPDRKTLVHADAHTTNLLMSADGELMFIDMADTDLGHPVFDYAGIALAMIISMNGDRCLGICVMDKAEIPTFISIAFARILRLTDPEEIKALIPRLVNLAFLKYAKVVGHNSVAANQMRPLLLNMLRNKLFGNLEQVKQDIQWFLDCV